MLSHHSPRSPAAFSCAFNVGCAGDTSPMKMAAALDRSDVTAPADPVTQVLERLVALCAAEPHPASRAHRARVSHASALDALTWQPYDWVASLPDTEYSAALASYLDGATQSVDVRMFHIALGRQTKPMVETSDGSRLARVGRKQLRDVLHKGDHRGDHRCNACVSKGLPIAGRQDDDACARTGECADDGLDEGAQRT
jgi:hypothetical protein